MAELNAEFVSKLYRPNIETWNLADWHHYFETLLEKMNEQNSEYVELRLTAEILNGFIDLLGKKLSDKAKSEANFKDAFT